MKKKMTGGSQWKVNGETHYQRHRQEYIDKAARIKKRNFDYIWAIKEGSLCINCGAEDTRVLEFDHLPQYEKTKGIAKLGQSCVSIQKIDKEIAKCEVVCKNCHAIRTWQRKQRERG